MGGGRSVGSRSVGGERCGSGREDGANARPRSWRGRSEAGHPADHSRVERQEAGGGRSVGQGAVGGYDVAEILIGPG